MTPMNKIGTLLFKLLKKNNFIAQVEGPNLFKKDNETVRHFALEDQQLVEKS